VFVHAGNMGDWGGGLHMVSARLLTFPGSTTTFEHNAGDYGGAIGAVASYTVLPPSNDIILGGRCIFRFNMAIKGGGAIYLYGQPEGSAKLTADSALFEYNVAEYGGGALCSTKYASIDTLNSVFRNNTANSDGGAIYMIHSTLELMGGLLQGNAARSAGGAIILGGQSVATFDSTQFTSNLAHIDGGAIASYQDTQLRVRNCTFWENILEPPLLGVICPVKFHCGGAAILVADAVVATINGETVLGGNHALQGYGGAILARDTSRVGLHAARIAGNWASEQGGGIAATEAAEVDIGNGTVVEGNSAGVSGGGVFAGGGTLRLGSAVLRRNRAAQSGGGILIFGVIEIYGTTSIAGNRAEDGGGVLGSGKRARLVITTAGALAVEGNEARRHGGGFYLEDSASYEITVETCNAACSGSSLGDNMCNFEWCVQGEEGGGRKASSVWGVASVDPFMRGRGSMYGGRLADIFSYLYCLISCCPTARFPEFISRRSMTAGCNFDAGDCETRFTGAGPAALTACNRTQCPYDLQVACRGDTQKGRIMFLYFVLCAFVVSNSERTEALVFYRWPITLLSRFTAGP
jgi:predicted outer membrane repeat protein